MSNALLSLSFRSLLWIVLSMELKVIRSSIYNWGIYALQSRTLEKKNKIYLIAVANAVHSDEQE